MVVPSMRILTTFVGIAVAVLAQETRHLAAAEARHTGTHTVAPASVGERSRTADALAFAVTGFVANHGQADPAVRYHGAAPQAGFYATDRGVTVVLGAKPETEVLMLRFEGGANAHPRI